MSQAVLSIPDAMKWARDSGRRNFRLTKGTTPKAYTLDRVPRNKDEDLDSEAIYQELEYQLQIHTKGDQRVVLRSYTDDNSNNLQQVLVGTPAPATRSIYSQAPGIAGYGTESLEVGIAGGVARLIDERVAQREEMWDLKQELKEAKAMAEYREGPLQELAGAAIGAITEAANSGGLGDLVQKTMLGVAAVISAAKARTPQGGIAGIPEQHRQQQQVPADQAEANSAQDSLNRLAALFEDPEAALKKLADFADTQPDMAKAFIDNL